jgi:hypothetical protein
MLFDNVMHMFDIIIIFIFKIVFHLGKILH